MLKLDIKVLLENKLKKYFLKYLEAILKCQTKPEQFVHVEKALGSFAAVIHCLGKDILLAGQPLTQVIDELEILRRQSNYSILHCRAFAMGNLLAEDYSRKQGG